MSEINSKVFEMYSEVLAVFCYNLGQVQRFFTFKEHGYAVPKDRVIRVVEQVDSLKIELLKLKKELGFTDGLDFLKNNKFAGFEIKDGRFVGSRATVRDIIDPWIEQDGNSEDFNNYRYEVGYLINFLAFPDALDNTEYSPLYAKEKLIYKELSEKAEKKRSLFGIMKEALVRRRVFNM